MVAYRDGNLGAFEALYRRHKGGLYRYLLRQSMGYFQNEFAGRIATKLMQTSLAVRETVLKVIRRTERLELAIRPEERS